MTYSTERKIACLDREIGMRRRVYPRFVQVKKMTKEAADEEIAVLEAILVDYTEGAADEAIIT